MSKNYSKSFDISQTNQFTLPHNASNSFNNLNQSELNNVHQRSFNELVFNQQQRLLTNSISSHSPQSIFQSPTISLSPSSSSLLAQHGNSSSPNFRNIDRTKLFVGNLPTNSNLDELLSLFKNYGRINEKLSVVKDQNYAFVHFYSEEDAKNALIALNDSLFKDRYIRVQYSNSQGHMKRFKTLDSIKGTNEIELSSDDHNMNSSLLFDKNNNLFITGGNHLLMKIPNNQRNSQPFKYKNQITNDSNMNQNLINCYQRQKDYCKQRQNTNCFNNITSTSTSYLSNPNFNTQDTPLIVKKQFDPVNTNNHHSFTNHPHNLQSSNQLSINRLTKSKTISSFRNNL